MEDNYDTQAAQSENAAQSDEQHSHHHHHHHHHHHGSHDGHHSSGRHHHSHHSHRYGGSHKYRLSLKNVSLKEWILRSLPTSRLSSRKKLSKFANSQKNKRRSKYAVLSSRVMFCVIVFGIMFSIIYYANTNTDDNSSQANYTPSETTQLKQQISSLQNEIEVLTAELEKYKAKYGELKDDN